MSCPKCGSEAIVTGMNSAGELYERCAACGSWFYESDDSSSSGGAWWYDDDDDDLPTEDATYYPDDPPGWSVPYDPDNR